MVGTPISRGVCCRVKGKQRCVGAIVKLGLKLLAAPLLTAALVLLAGQVNTYVLSNHAGTTILAVAPQ